MVIKSFKHKGLKKFFETGSKSKIKPIHAKRLKLILDLLDGVTKAQDMNFPGSNFHSLKGKLKKFYSVHVSGNWVVIFQFKNNDVYDVDYLDYH